MPAHTLTQDVASFTPQKLFLKPDPWDGSDQEDARLPGTGFPATLGSQKV